MLVESGRTMPWTSDRLVPMPPVSETGGSEITYLLFFLAVDELEESCFFLQQHQTTATIRPTPQTAATTPTTTAVVDDRFPDPPSPLCSFAMQFEELVHLEQSEGQARQESSSK